MKFLLLTYSDEKMAAEMPKEALDGYIADFVSYTHEIQNSGARKAGEALQPTSTATTIRLRDGKRMTTHGPFAETKEQLGGFYLIECDNLDEALDWAEKCPDARYGSIEVRPIMDFGLNLG